MSDNHMSEGELHHDQDLEAIWNANNVQVGKTQATKILYNHLAYFV